MPLLMFICMMLGWPLSSLREACRGSNSLVGCKKLEDPDCLWMMMVAGFVDYGFIDALFVRGFKRNCSWINSITLFFELGTLFRFGGSKQQIPVDKGF